MKAVTTLIHPKQIHTMTGELLNDYSLAVEGSLIVGIIPTKEAKTQFSAKQEYSLPTHVLMPGLINAHTHTSMNLVKGLADDLKLLAWLQNHIWPAEAATISPEFVRDGALLAMAELIRGGVTCFLDDYHYVDERAIVVDQVGMRAFLSEPIFKFSMPWNLNEDASLARTERLIDFCKSSKTVYPALFPHAPYSTTLPILEKAAVFARKHDLLIHSHLLESQTEINEYLAEYKRRPIDVWNEIGLIGPKTIAVHMTHVNDEDLEIIRLQKAHIAHCPESNMKLASRVAPVQKMLEMGINVALGTDGAASNNDLDMFGEMKSAAFLSKVTTDDPESLNAKTVLEMATINGAKALHLADKIGSIELGKVLDVIAIDMDTIETIPCFNPVSQLVYATPRNQVTHVWVNGKILMDNRKLTTIDEEALKKKAYTWKENLLKFSSH